MPASKLNLTGDEAHFQPLTPAVNQTIGNTSAALTSVPADARGVIISGDGSSNAVRFTIDGTTPTATLGHRIDGTDTLMIVSRSAVLAMLLIREDGADVVITVTYFK